MTSLANDHDHKLNLLMNFVRAEIHFSILVIVAAVNIPEILGECCRVDSPGPFRLYKTDCRGNGSS